jgi:transposase-like protein
MDMDRLKEDISSLESHAKPLEEYIKTLGPEPEFLGLATVGKSFKATRRHNKLKHDVIDFSPEVRQKVIDLASEGKNIKDIAVIIGVTRALLGQRCRTELHLGEAMAREAALSDRKNKLQTPIGALSESDRFQIQYMAGLGLATHHIASIMNISMGTLYETYGDDIQKGKALAVQKVSEVLMDMATDYDHPNETKFYLKAQAGWKEATQVEFPDKDGNPQSISGDTVNLNLSAEKMQNLITVLNEQV